MTDMDCAMLWLRNVVVRMIRAAAPPAASGSASYQPGISEGITLRRAIDGRLVVDIHLSAAEAAIVLDAKRELSDYPQASRDSRERDCCVYEPNEAPPEILACTRFASSFFTQGTFDRQTDYPGCGIHTLSFNLYCRHVSTVQSSYHFLNSLLC